MSLLTPASNSAPCPSGCRAAPVRSGFFVRASDGKRIQRYRCPGCKRTFSDATGELCYRQKKRHLNTRLFELLVGGFSQRRAAIHVRINRKTVVRKFIHMGRYAIRLLPALSLSGPKVSCLEFDDLETSVHTKLKPLSVTLAVEHGSRRILGFRVSDMPAKGPLARLSTAKYGPRLDQRAKARDSLFRELKSIIGQNCVFKSDQNPHYGPDVRKHFADHEHKRFKGRRARANGQGELKRGGFDPLFSLNHSCAMLRANINRLFRRTWCTTKLKERLAYHIAIYAIYHNQVLLKH